MTDPDLKDVDDLLAHVATQRPDVPADLMARVLIDADQLQPPAQAIAPQSLWSAVLDLIGGWPAIGGVAMAGVAGLWIGIAPPTGLDAFAATVWGDVDAVDLLGGDVLGSFSVEVDG